MLSTQWRKASYSQSKHCVEAAYRKSSYCVKQECVEVGGEVKVRDSQLGEQSPVIGFTPSQWNRFLTVLR
jgi:hypothetical protein